MELNPVGDQTERYYGNVDVPDGGYIGNEDGGPLIIFDYANNALQLGGANISNVGYLDLQTDAAKPAWLEGRIFYDDDAKSLSVYNDQSEVTHNLGRELFTRATNKTGSTILNGKLVYISGAQGSRPTIALAKADDPSTCGVIAMTTQDIDDNMPGDITTFGDVHDVDTDGSLAGADLYLSASVAGDYTDTPPTAPNFIINIGTVMFENPSSGIISISVGPTDVCRTMVIEDLDINTFLDIGGAVTISGTEAIGLDMSGGTFATAIQKWPGGTIQSTGDIVFQPLTDGTTRYQVKNAAGDADIITIDTTNKSVAIGGTPSINVPLTLYQCADSLGLRIFGYDDKSDVLLRWHVLASGTGQLISSGNFIFEGGGFLSLVATSDNIYLNTGDSFLFRDADAANATRVAIASATSTTEWTGSTPTLIGHVTTHSDADNSGAWILNGRREDGAGSMWDTGTIIMSHDGAGVNDQLAKLVLGVNTGAGVVDALTIDSSLNVTAVKTKLTAIGGFAILLTNTTGANTVQGQLVKADIAVDDAAILTAAGDNECFGVFLDSGVADDAEAWVVVAGIADVAMQDNTASTHGNWVETSDSEAGYANAESTSPAAAPAHFEEIGHCIESVAATGGGTHILARCVLHFN